MLFSKTHATRIIVHADDLGMSPACNRSIAQGLEGGWISSASLMANGACLKEAVEISQSFPNASFGVHLNITDFSPLTGSESLKVLCNPAGQFKRNNGYKLLFRSRKEVAEEWSAQVERIRSMGVRVSHLDSHHHVHTNPVLFGALKAVQRASGITRVRTTRNMPSCFRGKLCGSLPRAKKIGWHAALRFFPPRTSTTDFFGSVTDFVSVSREFGNDHWIGKIVEVMCHPGHEGDEYRSEVEILQKGLEVFGRNLRLSTYWDIT